MEEQIDANGIQGVVIDPDEDFDELIDGLDEPQRNNGWAGAGIARNGVLFFDQEGERELAAALAAVRPEINHINVQRVGNQTPEQELGHQLRENFNCNLPFF